MTEFNPVTEQSCISVTVTQATRAERGRMSATGGGGKKAININELQLWGCAPMRGSDNDDSPGDGEMGNGIVCALWTERVSYLHDQELLIHIVLPPPRHKGVKVA
jgi:hypothetical protein